MEALLLAYHGDNALAATQSNVGPDIWWVSAQLHGSWGLRLPEWRDLNAQT